MELVGPKIHLASRAFFCSIATGANCRSNVTVFMYIFILIILARASTDVGAERPELVEKNNARVICNKSQTFPGSIYKVSDEVNGEWCCECPPGNYVSADCKERKPNSTVCQSCPDGQYSSENNHNYFCTNLSMCDHLPYTRLWKGSYTEDSRCLCVDGTYSSNPSDSGCKKHLQCPKGFGVKTPGTSYEDVTCEKCSESMCADDESSTQKCSKCTDARPGTVPTNPSFECSTTSSTTTTPTCRCPVSVGLTIGLVIVFFVLGGMIVSMILYLFIRKKSSCSMTKEETADHSPPQPEVQSPDIPMVELPPHKSVKNSLSTTESESESSMNGLDRNESQKPLQRNRPRKNVPKKKPQSHGNHTKDRQITSPEEGNRQEKKMLLDRAEPNDDDTESTTEAMINIKEGSEPAAKALPDRTKDIDPKSKSVILNENEYREIFRQMNHQIIFDPSKDGHCQFASIAYAKSEDKSPSAVKAQVPSIRREVVEHMKKRQYYYEEFLDHENDSIDWDTYIAGMEMNEYGDNLTLWAAHELYGLCFTIIQTSGNTLFVPNQQKRIFLGHIDEDHGMHYVYLVPSSAQSNDGSQVASSPSSDLRVEGGLQVPNNRQRPMELKTGNCASKELNGAAHPVGNGANLQPEGDRKMKSRKEIKYLQELPNKKGED